MNTDKLRQLLKRLNVIMRCPHCGKKYNLNEIFLKGYIKNTYFLRLSCSACHTPVYATISINRQRKKLISDIVGSKKVQPVEKPKIDNFEQSKIKNTKITNDEIIQIHQFLEKFDGNFKKIFNK